MDLTWDTAKACSVQTWAGVLRSQLVGWGMQMDFPDMKGDLTLRLTMSFTETWHDRQALLTRPTFNAVNPFY